MALIIPTIESNPTFDAQSCPDFTDWAALSAGINGTGVISGMTVTQHTGSDMLVSIASGTYMIAYVVYAYLGGTATISAADTTDRRDIVTVNAAGTITVTKGTDSGTAGWTRTTPALPPVKPAIPSANCLLGEAYVAYNTTVITTAANIIDKTLSVTLLLLAGNNLSDLGNAATARSNLGLSAAGGVLSGTFPNPGFATTPALPTGTTGTTQAALNNSTKLSTTAYTDTAVGVETSRATTAEGLLAPQSNPTFTGTVTVPTPSAATAAASKGYVDGVAQGLAVKASVQEATAAALPANTYLAGVITVTATGTLTVDGIVVALNDRVLVQNEAAQANNGIYLCTTAGAIGVQAVLTRATDSNTGAEILGAFCFVEKGTVNANSGFVNTNTSVPTIGATAITYTQFSGAGEITPGTGLSKSGNTLSIATNAPLPGSPTTTTQSPFDTSTKVGTTAYVDTAVAVETARAEAAEALALQLSGGTMSGAIAMGSHKVTGLTNGSAAQDAAAFGQIAAALASYLLLSGGTMSGPIAMGTNAITGLTTEGYVVAAPAVSAGAVTILAHANRINNITVSASTTITMSVTSAVDGDLSMVRVTDGGSAQVLAWVNTENSTAIAPLLSPGSATLPTTLLWQYNGGTSKWRCLAVA